MNLSTEEIISRFKKSWIETEAFYDDLIKNYYGFGRLDLLKEFIVKLRLEGEDKNFRLGTSIHYLIISRSIEHGLREDQKYLFIETLDTNDFEVILKDGNKIYHKYRFDNLNDDRITQLLRILKDTIID